MPIVTISRQVGALGDVIAAIVSRKLGLDLISREKVHDLALNCDSDYSDACTIYECISSATVGIIRCVDVRVPSAHEGLICLHFLVNQP